MALYCSMLFVELFWLAYLRPFYRESILFYSSFSIINEVLSFEFDTQYFLFSNFTRISLRSLNLISCIVKSILDWLVLSCSPQVCHGLLLVCSEDAWVVSLSCALYYIVFRNLLCCCVDYPYKYNIFLHRTFIIRNNRKNRQVSTFNVLLYLNIIEPI